MEKMDFPVLFSQVRKAFQVNHFLLMFTLPHLHLYKIRTIIRYQCLTFSLNSFSDLVTFEHQHYKKKHIINSKIVFIGHKVFRRIKVVHKLEISLKNTF